PRRREIGAFGKDRREGGERFLGPPFVERGERRVEPLVQRRQALRIVSQRVGAARGGAARVAERSQAIGRGAVEFRVRRGDGRRERVKTALQRGGVRVAIDKVRLLARIVGE